MLSSKERDAGSRRERKENKEAPSRKRLKDRGNENRDSLPTIEFQGRMYIQNDFEGCAIICDEIIRRIETSNESIVPIGFDLEWPVVYSPGTANLTSKTALAQLCISPRTCHLFHIYNIAKLPAAFALLLSHPKVKLVGVNVRQDVRKLGRDFPGFDAQKVVENNCVECGTLMNQLQNSKERWSLARLTAYLLGKRLDKPNAVRKGAWHKLPLSQAQKTYAATDAYVGLAVDIPAHPIQSERLISARRPACTSQPRRLELRTQNMCKERLVKVLRAGRLNYGTALRLQRALAERHKEAGAAGGSDAAGSLILVEHEPVYTVGIRDREYDAETETKLRSLGADYYRTNRGGLITFHGPGQLVAYPIINLKRFETSVRRYVCQIERMMIRLCAEFGIKASTTSDTGVWVGDRKICAIGIHASRYVTTHGLALNCDTDLTWYDHIVPCGIVGKGVTSLSEQLGARVTLDEVEPIFRNAFKDEFQCSLVEFPMNEASELLRKSAQPSRPDQPLFVRS